MNVGQFRTDGTTAIATGGSTDEQTVLIAGTVNDYDGDPVRLQVEVRALGMPFTPAFTHESAFVASGTAVLVAVTGLTPGTSYHFQVRTVDAIGTTSDWTSFGANLETDADFSVVAAANTAPATPTSPAQFRADGTTPIATGATTADSTLVLTGALSDVDGGSVRMMLELRLIASPLVGTATHTGTFIASGGTATIVAGGLANGSYHWQLWAEDPQGAVSGVASLGGGTHVVVDTSTNTPPAAAANLSQGGLPVGGSTSSGSLTFSATVTDPDGGVLRLEIEVRPVGVAFSGTPSAQSALVASGTTASIALGGLAAAYHWQHRTVDSSGATSAWSSFGGNAESETDFVAGGLPPPPRIRVVNGCGASDGAGSPLVVVGAAVLVLVLGRIFGR